MKLNLNNFVFKVSSIKFLDYMVNLRGIEANLNERRAFLEMTPPKTMKNVQRLANKLVALSRFISKATDKNLPFFKVLRNAKTFEWTDDCEKAFTKLKNYLSNPLLLSKSNPKEELFLYLVVSSTVMNTMLVQEEVGAQLLVYYISHTMILMETRYLNIEKFALTLLHIIPRH